MADGERQSFRRQLHTAISESFPTIALPDRRHRPTHAVANQVRDAAEFAIHGEIGTGTVKEEVNGEQLSAMNAGLVPPSISRDPHEPSASQTIRNGVSSSGLGV